jgi:3-isopropylmalate/(R)-2-methylmalate dehydratase small subunit
MMARPIRIIEGRAIPFGRANVDTDLIIPAAHLKTISRVGLGRYAFAPLRQSPGSVFDDPAWIGAPILIAGDNFGCGSSREHAVWALADMGIEAVIAPSFSDLFASNAFKNGLLCVSLDQASVDALLDVAQRHSLKIDLETMTVGAGNESWPFTLDTFRRQCLVEGLDEISLTLAHEAAIVIYEASKPTAF